MKVARIFFISIVLILSGFTSDNAYSPAALLSKDDCIADLQFYRAKLEQYHANMYLYTPKKEFDRFFDSLIGSVKSSMNEIEFYNLITLVNSKIQDGHTQIFPSAESIEWHNSKDVFFPYQIFWIGKQMHVIYVFNNDPKIKPGAELLSLNGKPVSEIMQYMLQRQIHDGQNQTYPVWILNNWFSSYYSFHFGNPDKFSLVYRNIDNRIDSVIVNAISKDSIRFYKEKNYPEQFPENKFRNGLKLNFRDQEKTAILTIKSFDKAVLKNEYHQDFKSTIDEYFGLILKNKTENLILDLRDNQGGDIQNGKILLSWLQNEDFQMVSSYSKVNPKYLNDETKRLKKANGPCEGKFSPYKNHFTGKIYVLVNGGSFSNSGIVSASLRRHKRAVFIGEETGGNPVVLCGDGKNYILPHSKIAAFIPDLQFRMTDENQNTGHGLIPDYLIPASAEYIFNSNEIQLEFVTDLIKKKKS